ncbi:MAG TPA: hypothetical protein VN193_06590 [Candidatus Angelobacter sp.]|jgi:hypothetical protein|nr:hypothetical protein [Candidatus Angelobacter sp.]
MPDQNTAEAQFTAMVKALEREARVTLGAGRRGFGADALQVDGRIFAMVSRGHLVLKLPAERVAALIDGGKGAPFDAGKGRPMKEWVMLERCTTKQAVALAEEALAFVGKGGRD